MNKPFGEQPNKVDIPLAKPGDAELLKSLSIGAFKENFKKYGHYPPGLESLDWHKEKIENGIYHTIQYETKVVGGLQMNLHPNNEMKIEYLFISPEYQGRKIGAAVMGLVEKEYKDIKTWVLLTPYKDYKNHYFYEKLGYERTGEVKPDEKSNFTLIQYEKTIET